MSRPSAAGHDLSGPMRGRSHDPEPLRLTARFVDCTWLRDYGGMLELRHDGHHVGFVRWEAYHTREFGTDMDQNRAPDVGSEISAVANLLAATRLPRRTRFFYNRGANIADAWRGRGLGAWLYAESARLAWVFSRGGVMPNTMQRAGATSEEAWRVWHGRSLARLLTFDRRRLAAVWADREHAWETPPPDPPGIEIVREYTLPPRRASLSKRKNPSDPLPAQFHEHEYALMTVGEFMKQRNEGERFHASSTWASDLASLNRDWLSHLGEAVDDRSRRVFVYGEPDQPLDNLVFRDRETHETVAVLRDGFLYRTRSRTVPKWYHAAGWERAGRNLRIEREQEVKYPGEYVTPRRERNLADFPVLLRRLVRKGERLELRAERAPRPGRQDGLALFNQDGLIVGRVDDEWGATLLRVAEEYAGAGLGRELLAIWNEYNPDWQSGGFTVQGANTAAAAWSDRVRLFLARGWYTALVRAGRMTAARVRAITAGLPKRRASAELHGVVAVPEKADLRVYLDTDLTTFVLYDARFLADHDARRILGYGFLRDTPRHSLFFYRLEYEPKYVNLVTRIALQLARENRDPLFVAAAPSDLVPWELVPEALHSDGYVTLSRDVIPLRDLGRLEYLLRRPVDPHRELQDRLLEAAEHKWQ